MIKIVQHEWGNTSPVHAPMELGTVDLQFNDPPYSFGVKYADDLTGDRLPDNDYRFWCERVITQQQAILKPGGTFWWLCPEQHGDFIGPMLTRYVGPRVHRVIWHETFAQYQTTKLTQDYRFLFCHVKGQLPVKLNDLDIRIPSARQEKYNDKRANPLGRVPGAVWTIRRLQGTSNDHVDWHPAQLPPELLDRIIRGWCPQGGLVCDGFAGSGNMALSAIRNGRSFIGTDSSPTYVTKMKERIGQ